MERSLEVLTSSFWTNVTSSLLYGQKQSQAIQTEGNGTHLFLGICGRVLNVSNLADAVTTVHCHLGSSVFPHLAPGCFSHVASFIIIVVVVVTIIIFLPILGIEPRTLCILVKCSAMELCPPMDLICLSEGVLRDS